MVYHTFTKHVRLIWDLKIHIHGIPYIFIFTIMHNNILDSSYSMLFKRPWLHYAKVTHDWDNNLITIEGNNTVRTIIVIKHLDGNTKWPKVLFCYDFMNGVTNEEDILLQVELDLFTISTITLPKLEIGTLVLIIKVLGVDSSTKDLTFDFPQTPSEIEVDATLMMLVWASE